MILQEEKLHHLYDTELKQTLVALENKRQLVKWLIIGSIALVIAFFIFLVFNIVRFQVPSFVLVGVAAAVLAPMIVFSTFQYHTYTKAFQEKVIRRVLSFIDPSWTLVTKSPFPENTFRKSHLVHIDYDKFLVNDYINGSIGGVSFKCMDLQLQEKIRTNQNRSASNSPGSYDTIFHGLLLTFTFVQKFIGQTFLIPTKDNTSAKPLFVESAQGMTTLKNLDVNHPVFAQFYTVNSSEPINQTSVVSPLLIEGLLKIKQTFDMEPHLSFIDHQLVCAIELPQSQSKLTGGLFIPRVFKSGAHEEEITFLYRTFMIAETLTLIFNKNK
ncbi:MAG TPA: hypothetical protein DCS93_10615 [Microscillaceae bacterium]|nr:hypothetical protein [Microscillaceae bacterium]